MAAALLACSSEGDILPKKDRFTPSNVPDGSSSMDAAPPDVQPDVAGDGKNARDPNANCVKPGTPNNERGIGGYCEPDRHDCEGDAGPRFCTAQFAELAKVPDNQWFCSGLCTSDEECGTGAVCATNEVGSGCVPLVCRMDAGASTDAATAPAGTALWR